VEEMKKIGVKVVREEEWQIEGDLVLKKRKVYVPKDKKLRVEIIWLYTSSRTWGKVENNRAGDKKLLVAKSDKRYWKIYREMQYVPENEK